MHVCEACKAPVLLSGRGGWTGSRATKPPLKVICTICVGELGLEVLEDAAWQGVFYEGQLYLDIFHGQGFVRSEHPELAKIYSAPFPRTRAGSPTAAR
jgi:hypothetical protein